MTKAVTIRAWIGSVACTVSALAIAGIALAQQQIQDSQDQQQQTSDQEDQDRQQRDREQQDQDQSQQDQQRRQSDQERRQQEQTQRDETRNRQWSDQETSTWPQPNRDEFSRQGTQYQNEPGRQSTQFGSRSNEQDAGLGVNIISDQGPGVIVTRVYRGTPADQMGIREGDRITQLNNQDVQSANEFISRIRNMNPGDEVELEVLRNRDERTVRGELETRQEALLLTNRQQGGQRWQQDDRTSQTGYQESGTSGGFQQQGRTMRSGDYSNRLSSIEQQVNRLSRELEQIRFALQDLRQSERGFQQFGGTRESQAGYDEYQGGNESPRFGSRPQSEQWDGRSDQGSRQYESYQDSGPQFRDSGQQRQFEGGRTNDQSSAEMRLKVAGKVPLASRAVAARGLIATSTDWIVSLEGNLEGKRRAQPAAVSRGA